MTSADPNEPEYEAAVRRIAAVIAKKIIDSPAWVEMQPQVRAAADAISEGQHDSEALRAIELTLERDYGQAVAVNPAEESARKLSGTPVSGTLDVTLPMPTLQLQGTSTPPSSSPEAKSSRDAVETAEKMMFLTFVATIVQAVNSVVNDSPQEAVRSLTASLAMVIAWWLWSRRK